MSEDSKYLETFYQQFIHKSRYARYRDDLGRRENWEESVNRLIDFFKERADEKFPALKSDDGIFDAIRENILNIKVMPSMRCFMTAGKALKLDEVAGYNCSFRAIDEPKAFDEILYILMCGTGVGFSVERQYVNKLPEIPDEFYPSDTTIVVRDSKLGWASAYRELVSLLFSGRVPSWDTSKVRPKGSRLKTFGGRASGPEPLEDLFQFTVNVFRGAAGRKLTSIECHDIVCKVADIVVVGGVRRAALISLSNLSDERMRGAKNGQWWEKNPHRALSNNSVAYTEEPDMEIFMREWLSLVESKSGERGIFNTIAAKEQVKKTNRRDPDHEFRCNPCSEILLRNKQFCNLTEVVLRQEDDYETIKKKLTIAVILGTMQSSLTNFRYLSKDWKRNTEEEALLGVSLTGIMDHPVLNHKWVSEEDFKRAKEYGFEHESLEEILDELREFTVEVNKEWAPKIGVNQSAAITCVKPSGTVSQLVNSASGIHARYAPYYLRSVRADSKDPLATFMIKEGFPHEVDVMNPHNYVFYFPIKSPENSVSTEDRTAIEELEFWSLYNKHWAEHKPSVTINVKEHEWMGVGSWVWDHFSELSGVSFLPYDGHVYKQAPYQPLTEEQYQEWVKAMPDNVDWEALSDFENDTNAENQGREFACSAGACEI